jgi:hypothetical protein
VAAQGRACGPRARRAGVARPRPCSPAATRSSCTASKTLTAQRRSSSSGNVARGSTNVVGASSSVMARRHPGSGDRWDAARDRARDRTRQR